MKILVANIGSTSFKYLLYDMESGSGLSRGLVERIGRLGGRPDCESAIGRCVGGLDGLAGLSAVAFKAVHAGSLSATRLVDDELLRAMEEFTFLAPAHNPPYIAAMRAFQKQLPGLPLVALLETAFYDSLEESASTYPVPYRSEEHTSELQ